MRIIVSTTMPENIPARFLAGNIIVNRQVATMRGWRYTLCAIMHEFTHYLLWLIKPNRYQVGVYTYESLYKDEVICYRVQLFFEKLLRVNPTWDSPQAGAAASLSSLGVTK